MFISPSFFQLAGLIFKTIYQLSQNHSLNYDHKTVFFSHFSMPLKNTICIKAREVFFCLLTYSCFCFYSCKVLCAFQTLCVSKSSADVLLEQIILENAVFFMGIISSQKSDSIFHSEIGFHTPLMLKDNYANYLSNVICSYLIVYLFFIFYYACISRLLICCSQ